MSLVCQNLSKSFVSRRGSTPVLHSVSLEFESGGSYALLGPSGSGKTTLISILGCLLSPSEGEVQLDGTRIDYRKKGQLARLRRSSIGFVFQNAQLLPFLTIEDNLRLAGTNAGMARRELLTRIDFLLDALGVAYLRHLYPKRASGGERQRVAVARALLHQPRVVLADEPTASLDWEKGRNVIELLSEHARREGAILITVTHDHRLTKYCDNVFEMESGRVKAI